MLLNIIKIIIIFFTNIFFYIIQYFYYIIKNLNISYIIIFFLIFSVLFAIIYCFSIKIKYPFWYLQPVCHTFTFSKKNKVLTPISNVPIKTKFYNPNNIKTFNLQLLNEENKKTLLDFLQCFYIDTENHYFYELTFNSFNSYFDKCIFDTLVSIYYNHSTIELEKQGKFDLQKNIIGIYFSKPILFFYNNKNEHQNISNNIENIVFYWDFFATNPKKSTEHICRELFQTNEFNQRQIYSKYKISCFRKEIDLCGGVIPFVKFKIYTYYLDNFYPTNNNLHYNFRKITKKDFNLLNDVLFIFSKSIFSYCILPSFDNLLQMINSNMYFIFGIFDDEKENQLMNIYIFKNNFTNYEFCGKSIECLGGINICNNNDIFLFGFHKCCEYFVNSDFGLLHVSCNSHLTQIIPTIPLQKKTEFDCGFYFYNMHYNECNDYSNILLLV